MAQLCALLLLLVAGVSYALPALKPHHIAVQIAFDNQQHFDLGNHDRTNFELIEQFQPLARAYSHSSHKKIKYVYKPYVPPTPAAITQATRVLETPVVESTTAAESTTPMVTEAPKEDDKKEQADGEGGSKWLAWTSWTPCRGGERKRVRGCHRVDNKECEGKSVEIQKCFQSQAPIRFAKNPWTIENEISRVEP